MKNDENPTLIHSTFVAGAEPGASAKTKLKTSFLFALALAGILLGPSARAQDAKPWTVDVSLYGVAANMEGNVAVKGISADVDAGFDKIWDHLKFGGGGTLRLGYDRFALSTDLIYMDLEAVKGAFTADAQQWMVQPQLEYRLSKMFVLSAGARYNNLHLGLEGPLGVNPSGTQEWWDPIIGARVTVPLWETLSFNVSGDIGGFGVSSQLTWQAFPYFNWQFTKWGSLQVGYRFLYTDYDTGSGLNYFKYDMLTYGAQFGLTFTF